MSDLNPNDLVVNEANEFGTIPDQQYAPVMRKSMENKNLLANKGSMYIGTGNTVATTITIGENSTTYNTSQTGVLELPTTNGSYLRVNQSAPNGVEWDTATATGENAAALGLYANANGNRSIALGVYSSAGGELSTALGYRASASGESSTAIGSYSNAIGENAAALGLYANANGNNSIALGSNATLRGDNSMLLGPQAALNGNYSTVLGSCASATGNNSTVLGYSAVTTRNNSTAIGIEANASGDYSIALSCRANANGFLSTALGGSSSASGESSTAIGSYSNAIGENAIQLGRGTNPEANTLQVGSDNIYNTSSHTLTVNNISLNGADLESRLTAMGFKEGATSNGVTLTKVGNYAILTIPNGLSTLSLPRSLPGGFYPKSYTTVNAATTSGSVARIELYTNGVTNAYFTSPGFTMYGTQIGYEIQI